MECAVLAFFLFFLLTGAHIFAARYAECVPHSGVGQDGRSDFVVIRSLAGTHSWQVGSSGALGIARGAATNTSFHLEWRDDRWFCLRSLADLKVVQVEPEGSAQASILRTAQYGCTADAQLFQYKGRSLYSKSAASYINARELKFLRAHGDTMPWRPMLRETRQTRVVLEPMQPPPGPAFMTRLLALVSQLEGHQPAVKVGR